MRMLRTLLLVSVIGSAFAMVSGCTVSPVTGLVCPPGTHPGPYGHRCFAD
ncbi:hypothetical protein SAMN05192543_102530 [Paraburkholderia megapolitana]|uniref:Lipoprotein n=1 Tax=Paraburkholderia megapolitana TaxID=420953 RepID=A0A1I3GIJ0_9BURK|nr:hypothetical protein SAMN05192543_102530 [Paraburkholderia megapolitana]